MRFAIGENVGPYRIVEQLGQGGMATVFKAYHPSLDRFVAIKVLHPAFLEDPTFLARFQREARVVAKLEHPHIVPVYDFADHAGQPYLVMKFIEGETLKARLGREPLAQEEGLRIVEAIGGALSYAHHQGVLHRDIKPSNVLLTSDGGIYLADFGLARMAQAGETTLSNDMLLGTPQYISPEQARGERNLDEGTDVYSLGVVLYELVVGRVPFSADTPFSIIHDHIYTPLPMPRSVNPKVPAMVERILLKALAKDRADRFANVEELVQGFRAALGGPPATSRPSPAETRQFATTAPPPTAPGGAAGTSGAADRMGESRPAALAPAGPKRRARWLWIGSGLAITCVCLVGVAAVASNLGDAGLPDTATEAAPTEAAPESVPEQGALSAARQAVTAAPSDPYARLALADALAVEGLLRASYLELVKAGDLFLRQEEYALAAQSLGKAIEAFGGPRDAEAPVLQMLTQALFLGAADPRVQEMVEAGKRSFPEWDSWPAIEGRTLLLAGRPDDAKDVVARGLESKPDDYLAVTVKAEILLAEGQGEEAHALLTRMLTLPGLPAWLQKHINLLIPQSLSG